MAQEQTEPVDFSSSQPVPQFAAPVPRGGFEPSSVAGAASFGRGGGASPGTACTDSLARYRAANGETITSLSLLWNQWEKSGAGGKSMTPSLCGLAAVADNFISLVLTNSSSAWAGGGQCLVMEGDKRLILFTWTTQNNNLNFTPPRLDPSYLQPPATEEGGGELNLLEIFCLKYIV